MTFPVTINGNTYAEADFINYGHLTNFPNIVEDVAAVAGDVATDATTAVAAKNIAILAGGYSYYFDNGTGATDPGSEHLRFNNATLASATALYVDDTTRANTDIGPDLATWDDCTSTIRGKLRVTKQSDASVYALFDVTGSVVDNTGWWTITVAYITGNGSFTDEDGVTLQFIRNGDKGDTGATGATGPAGGSPFFGDDGSTPSVAPSATGTDAIAIGDGAIASAEEAFAYGGGAEASGVFSIAFGGGADANNTHAIAIGRSGQATNQFALTLGSESTASAVASTALGRSATASGTDAITIGRLSDSTGTSSIAIGGDSGTGAQATNDASIAIGRSATASGSLSIAIGGGDTSGVGPIAAHTHSIALGRTGRTRNVGQMCYSNTVFSTAGDAQWSRHLLQGSTTNSTPTEIGAANSSGNRIVLPSDSTFFFRAHVVARRTDADGESAGYVFTGVIDNNAGTTALVSTVTADYTNEDTAAWAAAFTADNTNDALVLTVTGENSKTIRWVAMVETVEVIG